MIMISNLYIAFIENTKLHLYDNSMQMDARSQDLLVEVESFTSNPKSMHQIRL